MPTDKTIFQLTADTSPALTDYALSGKDPAGTPTTVYVLWSNIAKMVLGGFSALGDIVYGGASGAPTKLAGNTTTTKKFLRQTGDGANSAAPAWDTVTKSDVGLGSVENTALSTWAGSSNITTLGTISTGTWAGGTIPVNKGGTGQTTASAAYDALSPMTTLGDTVYGGSSGTGTRLAGNTTTTKKYMAQTGNGSASAAPTWSQPAISELSDYSNSAEQDLGSITWTGGTAPTSLSQARYRWTKLGNIVVFRWRFEYGSAGTSNTKYAFALPGDCPTPVDFTGQGLDEIFVSGSGMGSASRTGQAQAGRCYLYKNSGGTYDVMCEFGAISSVMGTGCVIYAC